MSFLRYGEKMKKWLNFVISEPGSFRSKSSAKVGSFFPVLSERGRLECLQRRERAAADQDRVRIPDKESRNTTLSTSNWRWNLTSGAPPSPCFESRCRELIFNRIRKQNFWHRKNLMTKRFALNIFVLHIYTTAQHLGQYSWFPVCYYLLKWLLRGYSFTWSSSLNVADMTM